MIALAQMLHIRGVVVYLRTSNLPKESGLGDGIGWHTFRHTYRSWLDDTGAPTTVQKELMRPMPAFKPR